MQELEKLNKLVNQDYKFNLDDFAFSKQDCRFACILDRSSIVKIDKNQLPNSFKIIYQKNISDESILTKVVAFNLWTLDPKFTFIEIKNVHDDLVLESDPNLFFSKSFNFITHGFSKISQKQTNQDTVFLNNVIPEFKLILSNPHISTQTKILKHIIIMHKVNEYIKKQNIIPNLEIKNYE